MKAIFHSHTGIKPVGGCLQRVGSLGRAPPLRVGLASVELICRFCAPLGHLAVLGSPVLEPNPYLLLRETNVMCQLHASLVVHVWLAAVCLLQRRALLVRERRLFPHAEHTHRGPHCNRENPLGLVYLLLKLLEPGCSLLILAAVLLALGSKAKNAISFFQSQCFSLDKIGLEI